MMNTTWKIEISTRTYSILVMALIGVFLYAPPGALAGGDWIVDNVTISNELTQAKAAATNSFMGKVGIGTSTPSTLLEVAGIITAASFIGNGSSLTDLTWDNLAGKPADLDTNGLDDLLLSGGTMSGAINMSTNRITDLADAVADGDAVSKGHLAAALANISASGGLSMGIYTNTPGQ